MNDWPEESQFPVEKLVDKLKDALENSVDLTLPKNRYLRGLLLNTLCDEAVKFKSHPNCYEKQELAKCIISTWPHLKESIGRGYDGWLSSIVDCLEAKRRALGIVDENRSQIARKRKLTVGNSPVGHQPLSDSSAGNVLGQIVPANLAVSKTKAMNNVESTRAKQIFENPETLRVHAARYILDAATGEFLEMKECNRVSVDTDAAEVLLDENISVPLDDEGQHSSCAELSGGDSGKKLSGMQSNLLNTNLNCDVSEIRVPNSVSLQLPQKREQRYEKRGKFDTSAGANSDALDDKYVEDLNEMKIEWMKSNTSCDMNKVVKLLLLTEES